VENAYLYGAPGALGATGGLQQLNAFFLLTAAPETYNLPRAPSLASGLATVLGGPLLIIDLHTPQRWYNVLRIFRQTSPMSIGTWGLVSFGSLSAVLAAAQSASDHGHPPSRTKQRAIKLLEVPAALAGMAMSTYTGALLSATSTPVWAAAPRRIAALFGVSAMASGAAALTIAEQGRHVSEAPRALNCIALAASALELFLLLSPRQRFREEGVEGALNETKWGLAFDLGAVALGTGVPIFHHVESVIEPKQPPRPALVIALAVLAGGFCCDTRCCVPGTFRQSGPRTILV
jgi:protein NrfD